MHAAPKRLMNDKGGEFENEKLKAFLSLMGVPSKSTSAYSPFQNGVAEHHNGVLKGTMDKLLSNYCDGEMKNESILNLILQHSVFAKNAFLDYRGYSPLMRAPDTGYMATIPPLFEVWKLTR